jgi:hypothetical protein
LLYNQDLGKGCQVYSQENQIKRVLTGQEDKGELMLPLSVNVAVTKILVLIRDPVANTQIVVTVARVVRGRRKLTRMDEREARAYLSMKRGEAKAYPSMKRGEARAYLFR